MSSSQPSKNHSSAKILSSLKNCNFKKHSSHFFYSGPLEIDASAENIWKIVKNVEDYNRLSKGAVTAHVDGEIAPHKKITLQLYKDKWYGKFIPASEEIVSIIDDNKKIIGWERALPFSSKSERYQVLEKLTESKTQSSITLHVPGLVGLFSKLFLKQVIENSFKSLNKGIKGEAERVNLYANKKI